MSASITPFPCRARVGKARHVAHKILTVRAGAVDSYWRQATNNLRSSMEKVGIEEDRIEREVQDFNRLIVSELLRRGDRPASGMGDCA